jgi:hypothetical protein
MTCGTRGFVAFWAIVLAFGQAGWALINPGFTPAHLVEQSEAILAGPVAPVAGGGEWKLANARLIKGKAPAEHVLSLARCRAEHADAVLRALRGAGDAPAVLFWASRDNPKKTALLHVGGTWLQIGQTGPGRWDVLGVASDASATWEGGTDMLIRMCDRLVAEPGLGVRSAAGVAWVGRVAVGKAPGGQVAGLTAVEVGKARGLHLFVASPGGDRLFAAKTKDGETSFQDVTAAAKLEAASRRFAWVDLNDDGLADLVSFDGAAVSLRLAAADGTFRPADAGGRYKADAECIGLSACAAGRRGGVLLSTAGRPVLLTAGAGGCKAVPLPAPPGGTAGGASGEPAACIVADFDNDGYADVLQPGQRGGLLWRGTAEGFGPPSAVPVATGGGRAIAAVADFDGDGTLDVFLAGPRKNTLWAGDGKGGFREVLRDGGSITAKCPPAADDVKAMDLNHDGWADLCMAYRGSNLRYHFNRGYRCFGEENEVRLDEPGEGLVAVAAGDFNADSSQDLVVARADGSIVCYLNDACDEPGLRLRLPPGVPGPVTVRVHAGDKPTTPVHAVTVGGPAATVVATGHPGRFHLTFRLPAAAAEQAMDVVVAKSFKDVVLGGPPR